MACAVHAGGARVGKKVMARRERNVGSPREGGGRGRGCHLTLAGLLVRCNQQQSFPRSLTVLWEEISIVSQGGGGGENIGVGAKG